MLSKFEIFKSEFAVAGIMEKEAWTVQQAEASSRQMQAPLTPTPEAKVERGRCDFVTKKTDEWLNSGAPKLRGPTVDNWDRCHT